MNGVFARAGLAQLVERFSCKEEVVGSSPTLGSENVHGAAWGDEPGDGREAARAGARAAASIGTEESSYSAATAVWVLLAKFWELLPTAVLPPVFAWALPLFTTVADWLTDDERPHQPKPSQ